MIHIQMLLHISLNVLLRMYVLLRRDKVFHSAMGCLTGRYCVRSPGGTLCLVVLSVAVDGAALEEYHCWLACTRRVDHMTAVYVCHEYTYRLSLFTHYIRTGVQVLKALTVKQMD